MIWSFVRPNGGWRGKVQRTHKPIIFMKVEYQSMLCWCLDNKYSKNDTNKSFVCAHIYASQSWRESSLFFSLYISACNIALAPSCYVLNLFFSNSIQHQILNAHICYAFVRLFFYYNLLYNVCWRQMRYWLKNSGPGESLKAFVLVFHSESGMWSFTRIRIQWISIPYRPSKRVVYAAKTIEIMRTRTHFFVRNCLFSNFTSNCISYDGENVKEEQQQQQQWLTKWQTISSFS